MPFSRVIPAALDRTMTGCNSYQVQGSHGSTQRQHWPALGQHRPCGGLAGPVASWSRRAASAASARAFALWRPVVHRVEANPPDRCPPVSRFRVVRSDTSCDTAGVGRSCHMCLRAWLDGDATQRTCERRDAYARVDNDCVRKSGIGAPSTKVGYKPPG
jgi:hypothetical protein